MAAETDAQQHWQHVKALLAQVLDQPQHDRQAWAKRLSEGDAGLRDELMSLLAAQSDDEQLQGMPPELALEALQSQLGELSWSGRRIGPWRITSLVARGGMGEVYRAERADGQFEQQVAIKLLRSGFDREWLVSRFAVERQIVASLDHPNLARVLDGGTTEEGMPYFVMELVEGEPIDRYCQRLQLGVPERLALFRTVCQVVGYAHSKGVVHRDLKSDNILVTEQGVVKLVDFGIAKQLSVDADKTATGQRVMTLAFSSPEQVRGQEITPASDVYSLGVALYRLLTQASPYGSITADDGYQLTHAICDTEPQPPSRAEATGPLTRSQRRRLRGDLDAVVMKALRKDPAHRYANAAEMGDDIFRHMESLPVRARRGAWSYRANRFVLRHRAVFGAAMLANLALVVGLGIAIYQSVEANKQKQRAEAQQARAERHLRTVREFANLLIFDVEVAVRDLSGATAARRMIVQRGLDFLEKVGSDGNDPDIQIEIASGYQNIGDIQGASNMASLGEPKAALKSYERALALLLPLADASRPSDATTRKARRALAALYGHQSQAMESTGDLKGALAGFAAGISICEQLHADGDSSSNLLRLCASLFSMQAHAQNVSGDDEGFNRSSKLAIAQLTELLAADPTDDITASNLATAHGVLGNHLLGHSMDAAETREALAHYQQAARTVEPLFKNQPDSAKLARTLAVQHYGAGRAALRLNDVSTSIAELRIATAMFDRLAKKDSSSPQFAADRAAAASRLSQALMASGELTPAVDSAAEAVKTFEGLPQGVRQSMTIGYLHGLSYFQLGSALQARAAHGKMSKAASLADQRVACEQFKRSLPMLQRVEKLLDKFDTGPGAVIEAQRACP